MENSKIILATLIVLTLLVGGVGGYLIADKNQLPQKQDDFQKLMMLKAMTDARQSGPRQERPKDHKRDYKQIMAKGRDLDRKHDIKRMQNKHMNKEQMAHKKGEMFLKIMAKKCSLTEEQQKQVKVILNKSKTELQTAKDKFKGRLETIKDKADSNIENILTDAQKAEFKELKENARKYRMQQSKIRNNALKNYALRKQALGRESMRSFR